MLPWWRRLVPGREAIRWVSGGNLDMIESRNDEYSGYGGSDVTSGLGASVEVAFVRLGVCTRARLGERTSTYGSKDW